MGNHRESAARKYRGAEVSRERRGTAKSSPCFYHSCGYRNDGKRLGVAALDELARSGELHAAAGDAGGER